MSDHLKILVESCIFDTRLHVRKCTQVSFSQVYKYLSRNYGSAVSIVFRQVRLALKNSKVESASIVRARLTPAIIISQRRVIRGMNVNERGYRVDKTPWRKAVEAGARCLKRVPLDTAGWLFHEGQAKPRANFQLSTCLRTTWTRSPDWTYPKGIR